ncbi:hypothetical protein COT30_01275 [Candidatus Micrarchaeota archaeon CG08_land_8_20_14_0_20_49_17]|nr:MAG: hypothetical protein COT30_01275 [Candidatus Micrarchaeota archaeon CG08_land_8_20_14_0_20_49_17]PIZ98772.1 MAG: hypothetical protein COX84_01695 [Candidatus Micrarchaeota archaeon CG_4_10_14_0_2_um_filter_49_7]HII53203.1 ATP-binding protein [Candidatus Micrarchaeota archaeon]
MPQHLTNQQLLPGWKLLPGGMYYKHQLPSPIMYFSIEPKTSKEDLFNFDEPYAALKKCIGLNEERLVVVFGLRRTGKTSLMKVVYNELDMPKIYIDAREIFPLTPLSTNQYLVSIFIEFARKYDIIKAILEHVSAVEFVLRAEGKEREAILSSILKNINAEMQKRKTHLVIFIDEAQLLKPTGADRLLAYIYDNLKHIQIVVAGSEIGILEEFAGQNKNASLFGRAKKQITLNRLRPEQSFLFLKKGFAQAKKQISEKELMAAITEIDGIVGWLSMYGWHYLKIGSKKALETIVKDGSKIIADELEAFLSYRGEARRRYLIMLRTLSIREMRWNELKRTLELEEKKKINDSHISNYIEALVNYGFIEKEGINYKLADPLLKRGLDFVKI